MTDDDWCRVYGSIQPVGWMWSGCERISFLFFLSFVWLDLLNWFDKTYSTVKSGLILKGAIAILVVPLLFLATFLLDGMPQIATVMTNIPQSSLLEFGRIWSSDLTLLYITFRFKKPIRTRSIYTTPPLQKHYTPPQKHNHKNTTTTTTKTRAHQHKNTTAAIWGRFSFWLIFFKGVETTNTYQITL